MASSGNVTDEAIMAYIREQDGAEPGDGVDWQFTNDQARNKLKQLYPKVIE